MFTQPVSSLPPGPTETASPNTPPTTSSSSSRRLRGLGYLRNYTASHLLSRDHTHGNPASTSASGSSGGPTACPTSSLTRSVSYSPTPTTEEGENPTDRLSLVASLQDHLNRTAAPQATQNTHRPPARDSRGHKEEGNRSAGPAPDPLADPAATMTRARASTSANPVPAGSGDENMPSIRFSAYYDPRSNRPSLTFNPVSRTLPTGGEVIKVGRYSERDMHPNVPANTPSAAPVGFKSKVVSRRHCEFWCEDGKWYIKDVKSSSGTFLNHIRLSPPGQESRPFPLNDGDIVQLGIDFKGGEEMIFRCVKMRLELNRGWQNKPNAFNLTTHKRLRNMAASDQNNSSQDCSICLNSVAPCQSLFVAPCSHTWHYKCIRSLLQGPSFPIFICPNCRAAADLEADVDDPSEEWQHLESDGEDSEAKNETAVAANGGVALMPAIPRISEPRASMERRSTDRRSTDRRSEPRRSVEPRQSSERRSTDRRDVEPVDVTIHLDTNVGPARPALPHQPSSPIPIANGTPSTNSARNTRTPSPEGNNLMLNGHEGPITPRNDVGPWVFDGSAGRRAAETTPDMGGVMRSLNAAAEMQVEVDS